MLLKALIIHYESWKRVIGLSYCGREEKGVEMSIFNG